MFYYFLPPLSHKTRFIRHLQVLNSPHLKHAPHFPA
nr:MAG TPA: hypothetical protein [Caudoviricetes sp.]